MSREMKTRLSEAHLEEMSVTSGKKLMEEVEEPFLVLLDIMIAGE